MTRFFTCIIVSHIDVSALVKEYLSNCITTWEFFTIMSYQGTITLQGTTSSIKYYMIAITEPKTVFTYTFFIDSYKNTRSEITSSTVTNKCVIYVSF